MPISGFEMLMALSRIASMCWTNPPPTESQQRNQTTDGSTDQNFAILLS